MTNQWFETSRNDGCFVRTGRWDLTVKDFGMMVSTTYKAVPNG